MEVKNPTAMNPAIERLGVGAVTATIKQARAAKEYSIRAFDVGRKFNTKPPVKRPTDWRIQYKETILAAKRISTLRFSILHAKSSLR